MPASEKPTARIVLWVVDDGVMGYTPIAGEIRRLNPDVAVLLEVSPTNKKMRRFLGAHFPEHRVSSLQGGMVLLTKGTITDESYNRLEGKGRFKSCSISVNGLDLNLVLVDLKSNPFIHRREPLAWLYEHIRPLLDEPLLVLGDFNTPADSVYFNPFRNDLHNAFETAGSGYYVTWPVPVPLLALDQVWVSKGIKVGACRLGWSMRSSHRPVIVELLK